MPVPISEALDAQEDAASLKVKQASQSPLKYLTLSALAGMYVGVAVALLVLVSSSFVAQGSPSAKLIQGVVFGIALTLVVFAGAELFTGNVMVMLQGLLARKVRIVDVLLIWIGSLAGNLVGALFFSAMVAASGVITTGAPKGKETIFAATLAGIMKSKAALTGTQLFWRSVLCNMLVCLALWMAQRTRSDAAKLICLWWALLAFVASGFEHSIANMTIFGLGIFIHLPHGTWGELGRNLLWTVPGNIVGGGLLVGVAYSYVGRSTATPAVPTPPDYGNTPEYGNANGPEPVSSDRSGTMSVQHVATVPNGPADSHRIDSPPDLVDASSTPLPSPADYRSALDT